ncbi:hypothetical protein BJV78DRAFT_116963 [Lactifluus subvellereus]|nr:hypothetical protein BJV78DRAFT_116963 [Lactifluus subvellereus]
MRAGDSPVLGGVTGTRVQESRFCGICQGASSQVRDGQLSISGYLWFAQGGTAHRSPGLGRQNCKQRLGEYAAERAVLGFAASAGPSSSVGGRTELARGVGVGGEGGPYSDETDEDGMETESEMEEEDMDINALSARVTIVFEGDRGGALPGFKYEPDALREAILHPRPLLPTAAASLSSRARKRQCIDDDGHDDPMHTTADGANTNGPVRHGVELETAVERFLLCIYEADNDDGTDAGNEDSGGADEDQQQQSKGRSTTRRATVGGGRFGSLAPSTTTAGTGRHRHRFRCWMGKMGLPRRVQWRVQC